jgi:hypothetical protein
LVLQEEAAREGLQRHIWWNFKLPDEQPTVAYVSPIFNAVWVADSKKNFKGSADGCSKNNRHTDGFSLHVGESLCSD